MSEKQKLQKFINSPAFQTVEMGQKFIDQMVAECKKYGLQKEIEIVKARHIKNDLKEIASKEFLEKVKAAGMEEVLLETVKRKLRPGDYLN